MTAVKWMALLATTLPAPAQAATAVSGAAVTKQRAKLALTMQMRGILPADLPPEAAAALAAADAEIAASDLVAAQAHLAQLRVAVAEIRIDHAFVQAKFQRLDRSWGTRAATLTPKERERVLTLLDMISDAFTAGKYEQANRDLNAMNDVLKRRPATKPRPAPPAEKP